MSEKYLRITMPDGSKWDVPAQVIANHRATYYADKEKHDSTARTDAYREEFNFTMEDAYELKDWAANNMNWNYVEPHARKVADTPAGVDYQKGWVNGEKEIIEQ